MSMCKQPWRHSSSPCEQPLARRRPDEAVAVLDLAILGLLQDQELHGYEIRRRLRDELGLFANISFGSLYPALTRLEAAQAVAVTESSASPAPPSRPPAR